MNIKRIIGALLAFVGMGGFIFAIVLFLLTFGARHDQIIPVTSGLLGIIFFASGIALVNATNTNNRM